MKEVDGFYLDEDNMKFIKENTKKRGDKSRIVNEALTKLRQEKLNQAPKPKVTIKI